MAEWTHCPSPSLCVRCVLLRWSKRYIRSLFGLLHDTAKYCGMKAWKVSDVNTVDFIMTDLLYLVLYWYSFKMFLKIIFVSLLLLIMILSSEWNDWNGMDLKAQLAENISKSTWSGLVKIISHRLHVMDHPGCVNDVCFDRRVYGLISWLMSESWNRT